MPQAGGLQGKSQGGGNASTGAGKPWYDFSRIDNFGAYPDPEGAFPKPDSNILVPANTPFTSLASGTITGIDRTSSYGQVVTVKLDKPINSAATHMAYLHLTSIAPALYIGQHVSSGQYIGVGGGNKSTSGAMPGFALTSSDEYGHGSGWADNVKGSWINPQLNPVPVLNAAKAGSSFASVPNAVGATVSNIQNTITQSWLAPVQGLLVNYGEHLAVFTLAGLLIILGFVLLVGRQGVQDAIGAGVSVATDGASNVVKAVKPKPAPKPKGAE